MEDTNETRSFGLTGNLLKLIALVTMTIDHIGVQIFPGVAWFRIVGRLAFPIFAFMIAEGCRYTRNKAKYLGLIAGTGIFCQLVYYFAEKSLDQCILITFSLSICLIFAFEQARKKKKVGWWLLFAAVFAAAMFFCTALDHFIPGLSVDYGWIGMLIPFFIYLMPSFPLRLTALAVGLIAHSLYPVAMSFLGVFLASPQSFPWGDFLKAFVTKRQNYALLALIPLAFYNGKRGKAKLKYLFYVYYPLHLGVIWLISQWIR